MTEQQERMLRQKDCERDAEGNEQRCPHFRFFILEGKIVYRCMKVRTGASCLVEIVHSMKELFSTCPLELAPPKNDGLYELCNGVWKSARFMDNCLIVENLSEEKKQ